MRHQKDRKGLGLGVLIAAIGSLLLITPAAAQVTPAKLGVSMSHTGHGTAGSSIGYTITASVLNEIPTTGMPTITVTLPSELSITSISGPGWSCNTSGQTATCTLYSPIAPFSSAAPINLIANISPSATGTITPSVVFTSGAQSTEASAFDPTVIIIPPVITGLSPNQGPIYGGNQVTIEGTNLAEVTRVIFGSFSTSAFISQSPTSITVLAPRNARPSTIDVTVQTHSANSQPSFSSLYTYKPIQTPAITSPSNPTTRLSGHLEAFRGTAVPNSTIKVYAGNSLLGISGAGPDGQWTLTPDSAWTVGTHYVRATAEIGEYVSEQSIPITVTVVDEVIPTITTPIADQTFNSFFPTFRGTARPNSNITLFVDVANSTKSFTATTNSSGIWEYYYRDGLQNGRYSAHVRADTGAGLIYGTASIYFNIESPPQITSLSSTTGKTGQSLTITGHGFSLLSNGNAVLFGTTPATILASSGGPSQGLLTVQVPAGTGTVPVTVTVDGRTSTEVINFTYEVDPPVLTVVPTNPNNFSSALFAFTHDQNATVEVTIDNNPPSGVSGSSYSISNLIDGPHTARFRAVKGGVYSDYVDYTWTIDTVLPAAPVITSPANGTISPVDTPVTFSGSAEPNSLVKLFRNGVKLGEAQADSAGLWAITAPSTLAPATHRFDAAATDAAGNTSVPSAAVTVTIASAPNAPVITSPADGTITGNRQISVGGTAEANAAVSLYDGAAWLGFVTASASGDWNIVTPPLSPGLHTLTAKANNGMDSAASAPLTVTIVEKPSIQSMSITTGRENAQVVITGTNFHPSFAQNTVMFGALEATIIAGDSQSLTVQAPAGGSGTVNVTVTTHGLTSTDALTYTYIARPVAGDIGFTTNYNTTLTINLSDVLSGGPTDSLTIISSPENASATVSGKTVIYTPTTGYYGPDLFTYQAEGPGGTSNVAKVFMSVLAPPPPVVTDISGVVVSYNSTAHSIDLSANVSGVWAGLMVSSPAHGTVAIDGNVATYVPANGYHGADSFTFTATGEGGLSNTGTVTLTVAPPPAPVVTDISGVAVGYNSTGHTIDLTANTSGVWETLSVGQPTHGTVTLSGNAVIYVPNNGHYGADSFTFTATGPGGASNTGTVSLNVATPPAPVVTDISGVAVGYNSTGHTINLFTSVSGLWHALSFGQPANGSVVSTGNAVTYVPNNGYYGADSFTFTATGAGGSNSGTVRLNVDTPPAPVVTNISGIAVVYNSQSQPIDLSANTSGVWTSFSVAQPTHGTVTLNGNAVTYVPANGYYGADSFTFTANGAGGASNTGTVSLNVATPPAPMVGNSVGNQVAYNSTGHTLDLANFISGVWDTVSVTAPQRGTVSVSGSVITYIPNTDYYGSDAFNFTAHGPGGSSAAALIDMRIATPAAPTASDVTGVAIDYNAYGQRFDVASSLGGVWSNVNIATAPAHGSVISNGSFFAYTPNTGYYGADSFTYTVSGPGGTSAPANITLNVANPAAPTVSGSSALTAAYNSTGQDIDLSAHAYGVWTSITLTQPQNGTVTLNGHVATYVPNSGFYGADSFTFTAHGPGGASSAATMMITVATPAAPTVSDVSGVAVGYNSTGQTIDLSASASGVWSYFTVAQPAHGTVTLNGNVVTYVPANGYHGADSFTFTATGAGGVSNTGTVSLNVAAPPAPVIETPRDPIVAPPASGTSPGQISVPLNARSEGIIDGYRITANPNFGSAEIISGTASAQSLAARASSATPQAMPVYELVYTPVANFMGTDTVSIVAYGPGGDSAPATFSFQVAGKAADLSGQTASNTALTFNPTAGLVGGPFNAVRITRAPEMGQATVDGLNIVFTPALTDNGTTSLDYVVDLAFGSSLAGRIDLTVAQVPGSQSLTAATVQGHPVTVRISDTVGGPFTAASVTSISPATAGQAKITGNNGVYDLTFTPEGLFAGEVEVGFALSNAVGTTPGIVTITVAERADPALDPEVRALASGQVTAARRFADTQIDNFQRRLEAVRHGKNGSNNGVSLNFGMGTDDDRDPRLALRRQLGLNTDTGLPSDPRERDRADLVSAQSHDTQNAPAPAVPSSMIQNEDQRTIGFWTSGSVDWGKQDASGTRDSRFSTQGVTAGMDVKVTDRLIVGAGIGYGEDKTRSGEVGTQSHGQALTGAAYASWRPNDVWFLDGVAGLSDLDFDSRRRVNGMAGQDDGFAFGERSGEVRFIAASIGRSLKRTGYTTDLYARLETRDITLDAFTETGGGISALDWDALEQSSTSINLGASWRRSIQSRRYGQITPSLRFEWAHELEDIGNQGVRYADWDFSPTYLVRLEDWSRNAVNLDLGMEWSVSERLQFDISYRGMLGDASSSSGAQIGLKYGW